MLRIRFYFIFLLFFFIAGCLPEGLFSKYKAPLREQGEVIIYLQSMPQEAEKLRFNINTISAVRDDGLLIPLSLAVNELKGADLLEFKNSWPQGSCRRVRTQVYPFK